MLLVDLKGGVFGHTSILDGGLNGIPVDTTVANIRVNFGGDPLALLLWIGTGMGLTKASTDG